MSYIRKPPTSEELTSLLDDTADNNWQTYECELVTPLYGGGIEAGVIDEEMPIRASSIRGQLRFWWRITCSAGLESWKLFKQETAIWGGIGSQGAIASRVEIKVTDIQHFKTDSTFTFVPDKKNPGQFSPTPKPHKKYGEPYSLFPAQGKLEKDTKKTIEKYPDLFAIPGLTFKLHVRINKNFKRSLTEQQEQQVQIALRWWASFGGLGARTRRGLGAIKIAQLDPIKPKDVEALNGKIAFPPKSNNNSISAWKDAINRLKKFRQEKDIGRNPPSPNSESPAGQSRWPEADSIRNLSGCYLNEGSAKHKPDSTETNLFPRAAFGLPIVFHFKDGPKGSDSSSKKNKDPSPKKNKDPIDHILEPEGHDRMASPLILRPYWDGENWSGIALLLPNWQKALKQPLKFLNQVYQQAPQHWPENSESQKKQASSIKPMQNRNADDPLSAFMQFFKKGHE